MSNKGKAQSRKLSYWETETGLRQLTAWRKKGLTFEDISGNIGVSVNTLKKWRDKSDLINNALIDGDVVAVSTVVGSLYRAATSDNLQVETSTVKGLDKSGNLEVKQEFSKTVRKGPNVAAMKLFLEAYKPDVFGQKTTNVNVAGQLDTSPIEKLDDSMLEAMVASLSAELSENSDEDGDD